MNWSHFGKLTLWTPTTFLISLQKTFTNMPSGLKFLMKRKHRKIIFFFFNYNCRKTDENNQWWVVTIQNNHNKVYFLFWVIQYDHETYLIISLVFECFSRRHIHRGGSNMSNTSSAIFPISASCSVSTLLLFLSILPLLSATGKSEKGAVCAKVKWSIWVWVEYKWEGQYLPLNDNGALNSPSNSLKSSWSVCHSFELV